MILENSLDLGVSTWREKGFDCVGQFGDFDGVRQLPDPVGLVVGFSGLMGSGDLASPQFLHPVEGFFVGHGDLDVDGSPASRSKDSSLALKKSGGVADIELSVTPHVDSIAHPGGGE